jgi:hypothetical protein
MRAVFISHASQDLDWPDNQVVALASRLRDEGVVVHLDIWYQQKQRRKLGIGTWNRWMASCLRDKPLILCLGSAMFAKRCECDPAQADGKGIAFETTQVLRLLYQEKQHNDGWLWLALVGQANEAICVPEHMAWDCAPYRIPGQLDQLVADLAHHALGDAPAHHPPETGVLPPVPEHAGADDSPGIGSLAQQQTWAAESLAEAPKLLTQLKRVDTWRGQRPPGLAQFDAASLAAWLAGADATQSDAAMLATRRALGRLPDLDADQRLAAEGAAVALYCLAACRRVELAAAQLARKVGLVAVPSDAHLYCAMVATVLAGGRLELQPGQPAGAPVPAWSFDVYGVATGDGRPHAFDRAVYAALFAHAERTTEFALDAGPLTDKEASRIRARLKQLREVDDQAVALVVRVGCHREQAEAFGQAHALPLFIADPALAADVLGLDANDFVEDLSEFWLTLAELPQHLARERAATPPAKGRSTTPTPIEPA